MNRNRGVGFRKWSTAVLIDGNQKKIFLDFLREYRSRCLASAFGCGAAGLDRSARFRYVPVLAMVARHVLNRANSIRKATKLWPMLTVKFTENGRRVYGDTSAPVVIDKAKRELRIPFLKIRKKTGLAERIAAELSLKPRPRFVAQLVLKRDSMGRDVLIINILAFRKTRPGRSGKVLALAYDINSRHGIAMIAVADDGLPRLVVMKRYRPPNHGRRRRRAAELQRLGRREEASMVRRKEKRLNIAFEARILSDARKLIRKWQEKGYTAYILVDAPEADSLRGTELSGTLNVARMLRNLARYEGAHYRELRASGKYCPVCGQRQVAVEKRDGRRVFICQQGHRFDRDFSATWNLLLRYFRSRREDVRELLRSLGTWALGAPPP